MTQQLCPFLATVDQNYNQGPPVDYPSFENRCLAGGEKDSLLFPHQATFCLSSGHRVCPLFKAARQSTSQSGARQGGASWQPVRTPRSSTSDPNTILNTILNTIPNTIPNTSNAPQPARVPANAKRGSKINSAAKANPEMEFFDSVAPPLVQNLYELQDQASVLSGSPLQNEPLAPVESTLAAEEWLNGPRRWGGVGAGLVFFAVLILGGLTAAWIGWSFANAQLETQTGIVSISQPFPTPTFSENVNAYVIWTATPPAGAVPVATAPASEPATQIQNEAANFPVAVTATATPVGNPQNPEEAPLIVIQPPEQAPVQVPANGQLLPDIEVEIPTRRPTPEGAIAVDGIAAPGVTETPTQTPTPLGTPVVIFGPDAKILKANACTTVRWSVQNVKEVYYENLGVNGSGEKEECIREQDGLFTLRVVLPNGAIQVYTTTVTIDQPTATPSVTPTFTPEVAFTPTWTPQVPTATATPNIRRGVSLAAQSDSPPTCAIDSGCKIGLLVSNTGEQIDNLTVQKQAGAAWSAQLCRADGVCGNQIPLVSVGPGNTVFLELQLVIPADATVGQQNSYQFIALSDGSGGTVGSQSVTIEVTIQ